jgi:hypothetical protein
LVVLFGIIIDNASVRVGAGYTLGGRIGNLLGESEVAGEIVLRERPTSSNLVSIKPSRHGDAEYIFDYLTMRYADRISAWHFRNSVNDTLLNPEE